MAHKVFQVKVQDTLNMIFQGEIDRLSSYNEVGRFDIYPGHANFISIIHKEVTLYSDHKLLKQIPVEQAILKVKGDVADVFLGMEALFISEESIGKENTKPTKS